MGGGGDVKPNPVLVGERIKNIRLNKRMTGSEFGRLVDNVDKGQISHWEKGVCLPNAIRLGIIADIAGITIYELLYGEREEIELKIGRASCRERV